MKISLILEQKGIDDFIKKRGLLKQYQKMKVFLLNGYFEEVNFQKRKPHHLGICYCRVNKQYRAWGYLEGTVFKIVKIDDHQN